MTQPPDYRERRRQAELAWARSARALTDLLADAEQAEAEPLCLAAQDPLAERRGAACCGRQVTHIPLGEVEAAANLGPC
jgi:hypothetical protein